MVVLRRPTAPALVGVGGAGFAGGGAGLVRADGSALAVIGSAGTRLRACCVVGTTVGARCRSLNWVGDRVAGGVGQLDCGGIPLVWVFGHPGRDDLIDCRGHIRLGGRGSRRRGVEVRGHQVCDRATGERLAVRSGHS